MNKSFNKKEAMKSYILAANLLPERLWRAAFSVSEEERIGAEEFRLRAGRPFAIVISGVQKEISQNGETVLTRQEEIDAVVAKATEWSFHSWEDQVRQGFITVKGGHRIGLCGSIVKGERGETIDSISSLNIRIAKQVTGSGLALLGRLTEGGFKDALIMSPPGVGKTTVLRDLCRLLSRRYRVAVADCRYEIGGGISGPPVFDLGRCDLMRGGEKGSVINMLTRSMSPEIIAVDEITCREDIEAIEEASYTGCAFLATAHGGCMEDAVRRPLYKRLFEAGIFKKVVFLDRFCGERICRIYERDENNGQADWRGDDNCLLLGNGDIAEQGYEGAPEGA